ncbi:MAG: AI-2E family transporter [Acutalibacteraceae bacterium]|nr:AI-2E family transporter [Acutalibacteraceae bacterium]
MSKKKFKQLLALIAFGVFCMFVMNNLVYVWNMIGTFLSVSMPFIIGFCIAFLINKPYMFFAEKAFKKMEKSKFAVVKKARKPVSLLLAYLLVLGIITFLICIIIPQLITSFNTLADNFYNYAESFKQWLVTVSKEYLNIELTEDNDLFTMVNNLVKIITGGELKEIVTNMANALGPDIFNTALQFTTNLYNIIIGLVASIYFLGCKDKLLYQTKKLAVAVLPEKVLPKTFEVAELSNKMFGRYVYGRIIDSLIIGMLCFIGMSIFHFDYALLISVVVGITNVIPVFGPFIGAIPSILILLIVNPLEAVWFTVFIFVLQQLDGNLIGPKVVGDSIGISGFWIMVSVIVGGGLFGVVGMFIAVPVFAIIYVLIGSAVNKKLKEKNYLQQFGDSPDTDIITDAEKPVIDFKEMKLYKTIKENVNHTSKKSNHNKHNIDKESND